MRARMAALGILLGIVLGMAPVAAEERQVDVELVLAIDASASISTGTLAFQLQGHAAAFRDPLVAQAIAHGPHGAIAVTLVEFSGPSSLTVLVPWTVIASAEDAVAFAERIPAAPAGAQAGSTALGSAVLDALPLFENNGIRGDRRVIDLCSNGFSNSGIDTTVARAAAEAAGITVNALAILDEYDWLEEYYLESVIGGPFAFVRTADGPESFVQALRSKLIAEIVGVAVAPSVL